MPASYLGPIREHGLRCNEFMITISSNDISLDKAIEMGQTILALETQFYTDRGYTIYQFRETLVYNGDSRTWYRVISMIFKNPYKLKPFPSASEMGRNIISNFMVLDKDTTT